MLGITAETLKFSKTEENGRANGRQDQWARRRGHGELE
jgi:hypothetical protein